MKLTKTMTVLLSILIITIASVVPIVARTPKEKELHSCKEGMLTLVVIDKAPMTMLLTQVSVLDNAIYKLYCANGQTVFLTMSKVTAIHILMRGDQLQFKAPTGKAPSPVPMPNFKSQRKRDIDNGGI